MKCSICGSEATPGAARCGECGARLPKLSPFDPEYVRPAKKRKTWLWVMLSVIVVCVLIIIVFSMVLFSFAQLNEETIFEPPAESIPTESVPTVTIPAQVTSEDCFVLAEGVLRFLPERHDGSPIVHVPETIGGQTVTAIGPECFVGCDSITTILLPQTVTGIHPRAFAGCTELRGLFLPEGCTLIGKDAFSGCVSLEAIHIPSTMDAIASGVFDDCAAMSYIFYSGSSADWKNLYTDYITPYTYVICLDGDFYHGAE